jgi:hypothetical protein
VLNDDVVGDPMRRARGQPRLPLLRLTAPENVAITPDQYRQTVELLAAMMLNYHYAHRSPAELPDNQPPTVD